MVIKSTLIGATISAPFFPLTPLADSPTDSKTLVMEAS